MERSPIPWLSRWAPSASTPAAARPRRHVRSAPSPLATRKGPGLAPRAATAICWRARCTLVTSQASRLQARWCRTSLRDLHRPESGFCACSPVWNSNTPPDMADSRDHEAGGRHGSRGNDPNSWDQCRSLHSRGCRWDPRLPIARSPGCREHRKTSSSRRQPYFTGVGFTHDPRLRTLLDA